jgi:hypothetical protein
VAAEEQEQARLAVELQQLKQDCHFAQSFNIAAEQDPCILPGHVSVGF